MSSGPELALTPALIPVLLAYAWLAVAGVALAVIDVRTHRLPDRIVLPGYAVGVVLLGLAALLSGDVQAFMVAVVGAIALFAFFLLLRVLSRSGMGGGDVKLAGVLGLFLGWIGWTAVLLGVFAAFLLGGLYAAALLVLRRGGRRTQVPFGPWMLAGAWIGILGALAIDAGRAVPA
ncbi:prepilin peptidase [Microbacterium sp. CJ88]|uniref:prepilin peptidase n=1 Tax=Microbacterium sp. CJ88 TaxID=3445672 RepID=UPI003F65DB80